MFKGIDMDGLMKQVIFGIGCMVTKLCLIENYFT